jgi:hypothetical protein
VLSSGSVPFGARAAQARGCELQPEKAVCVRSRGQRRGTAPASVRHRATQLGLTKAERLMTMTAGACWREGRPHAATRTGGWAVVRSSPRAMRAQSVSRWSGIKANTCMQMTPRPLCGATPHVKRCARGC